MTCCQQDLSTTKCHASLIFLRGELLYDAAAICWAEGHVMPADEQHARHMVQDVVQDIGADRAARILALAYAEATEALYPFTKQEATEPGPTLDDKLREPEQYTISLALPAGFSETTLRLLEHLVHDYLVYRVIAEWLLIVRPERAEVWVLKATALRERMRSALTARFARLHRKMKPW